MAESLIQSDPDVILGKPVVRGTRITVETILRKLSCGESIEQILDSHPRLTREAILAAPGHAAEAMGHETVHAVMIGSRHEIPRRRRRGRIECGETRPS